MHIDPTREQFNQFKSMDRNKPVNMLNMIMLNKVAKYPDGREASGAEAYTAYGNGAAPIFHGVGGSILWRGKPNPSLIGPTDEAWDIVFIAHYPSLGAFLSMVTNPDYQAIVHHRQAAVRDSRLIPLHEAEANGTFG